MMVCLLQILYSSFDSLIPDFLDSIDNVISVSEYIILCYYLSMNHVFI